jgi:5-methylcytosine-specific restriction endonuclease McrA
MRTSTSYVREQVFKRDRGVCSICQTDTVRLANFLRKLEWRARRRYCDRIGIPYARARKRSLWDADHIKAVVEGGGECDLDNLRTVCIPCHRLVTAKLMTRRRAAQGTSTAAANDPDVQPGSPA